MFGYFLNTTVKSITGNGVIDTDIQEDNAYNAGDSYALKPFSFVILSHKREEAKRERQKIIPSRQGEGR
mgnify:CR=1 FL=1